MKTYLISICAVFVLSTNFLIAEKIVNSSLAKNQKRETVQISVPSVTRRVKYNIAVLPKDWFDLLIVPGANPANTKLTINFEIAEENFFEDLVCAVDDTEKVNVIERAKLQVMLDERSLQNTGVVATDIKNRDKPILGIHYYLTATWNKSGENFVVRTRLFDIRTGEIITGRARKSEIYETIESAVSKVLNKLGDNTWYARVIRIEAYRPGADALRSGTAQGGFISDSAQNKEEYELELLTGKKRTKAVTKVYLSAGQREGVLKNDQFYVVRDMGANAGARDLIDPETGRAVGQAELRIGLLRVTEVFPGYSIAMIETQSRRIQRGDRIIPFTGTFVPNDILE